VCYQQWIVVLTIHLTDLFPFPHVLERDNISTPFASMKVTVLKNCAEIILQDNHTRLQVIADSEKIHTMLLQFRLDISGRAESDCSQYIKVSLFVEL